jgi:hypothetical protein
MLYESTDTALGSLIYHHHLHWQRNPLLRRYCEIATGFHVFGFRNNNLFTEQSPTPNVEDQVLVLMSPSDRVAQLYHQALDSLFIVPRDSRGYSGDILTRLRITCVVLVRE